MDEHLKNNSKNHYDKNISVCMACLSFDRLLSPLNEYANVFRILFTDYALPSHNTYLCWECMATLKRIIKFKSKVDIAQKILSSCHFNRENRPPKCLSNLTMTVLTTETLVIKEEDMITEEIKEEDIITEEIKDKVEEERKDEDIKQELDYYSDVGDICIEYTGDLNNDLSLLETVKKEDVKEEKYVKRRKYKEKKGPNSRNFSIITTKDFSEKRTEYATCDLRSVRKLVAIKHHEVKLWMDKQRNEYFFKHLRFKCTSCVRCWTAKCSLIKHMRKFHDNSVGNFVCDICQCRFRLKTAITRHIRNHYFVQKCDICGYQCYTSQGMRWHVTTHRKIVECMHCGACFHSRRLFRKHYGENHDVFICDYCEKRCHSKAKLENHIRRKHQTNFPCKLCGKQFKRIWSLTEHTRLRHEVRRSDDAYCALCDTQFDNAHQYRRHVRTSAAHAHERGAKVKLKIPCPSCDKVYCRKEFMMNHYRHVHLKQSKYYCADCDKGFLNRTKFVDHRNYFHEGKVREKNKLCTICGRGFAASRTLINHIRTHTGERPFECEHCPAKFTQKHAMLSHVKYIHLKNKRGAGWKDE